MVYCNTQKVLFGIVARPAIRSLLAPSPGIFGGLSKPSSLSLDASTFLAAVSSFLAGETSIVHPGIRPLLRQHAIGSEVSRDNDSFPVTLI